MTSSRPANRILARDPGYGDTGELRIAVLQAFEEGADFSEGGGENRHTKGIRGEALAGRRKASAGS
jgi:hypothetical protein